MAQPHVVAVILNWNGREDSLRCLEAMQRQDYSSLRLLFVDNGSHDGSEAAVRERFGDLDLLQTGANLGYAGGNNAGIAWALAEGADHVLVLNNDTVPDPGFVSALVRRAAAGSGITGAVIPYAHDPDRLWAYGGGRFDIATGWVRHVQRPVDERELTTRGSVHFYITGCAMLLSRAVLEDVEGFDPGYFHFCEDVDLCLRAEAAGHQLGVAPDARVLHRVSATTRVSSPAFLYYNLRSRLRLVQRFGPPGAPSRWSLALLWLRLWRPALQSGLGRAGWAALARAWQDSRAGVTGPAPPLDGKDPR